jgi:three-Cys-motif partner protein
MGGIRPGDYGDSWYQLVAQRRYGDLGHPREDGRAVRLDHEYALEKVELWWRMASTASLAMRRKWPWRACIDTHAACGVNRIRETNELRWGSALLALQISYPFDMYVFCEQNRRSAMALTERIADDDLFGYDPLTLDLGSESLGAEIRHIKGDTSELKVVVITGDANEAARYIRHLLPAWPGKRYCLTLIDPTGADFRWDAMTMLTADERMDLMFLFPEDMDIERNALLEAARPRGESRYDRYFADPDTWRSIALNPSVQHTGPLFRDLYKRDMRRLLGYRCFGHRDIRISNKVGEIYTLLFCSKHERGKELWDKVNRPEFDQPELYLVD